LFETGLKFIADTSSDNGVQQIPMIAGVCCGNLLKDSYEAAQNVDFFTLKGDVERLISQTGQSQSFSFVPSTLGLLHPGQGADVVKDGQVVGFLGALHPQFSKIMGVSGKVYMFEIMQSALTSRVLPKAQPTSKFPTNKRDIAIVVNENVSYANLEACIKNVGVNQLVDLTLFDIYQGEGIADGEKSLAISITLSDPEKTLEEAEIQSCVDKIVSGLTSQLAATLRE
jgi:phenylalanyl-tRNA synthetase beta chain